MLGKHLLYQLSYFRMSDFAFRHASVLGVSCGGANGGRTRDLVHAMQALSQLSYSPTKIDGFGVYRI